MRFGLTSPQPSTVIALLGELVAGQGFTWLSGPGADGESPPQAAPNATSASRSEARERRIEEPGSGERPARRAGLVNVQRELTTAWGRHRACGATGRPATPRHIDPFAGAS